MERSQRATAATKRAQIFQSASRTRPEKGTKRCGARKPQRWTAFRR